MTTEVYTVKWLQNGQAGPYQDTERRALITITRDGKPVKWHDSVVKQCIRGMVGGWSDTDSPEHCWASPTLKEFYKKSTGEWYVRVVEAYTG